MLYIGLKIYIRFNLRVTTTLCPSLKGGKYLLPVIYFPKMKYLILILTLTFWTADLRAQISDDIDISGYLQGMPVWINAELPEPI